MRPPAQLIQALTVGRNRLPLAITAPAAVEMLEPRRLLSRIAFPAPTYRIDREVRSIASADFDRNGTVDLAIPAGVMFGRADGTFAEIVSFGVTGPGRCRHRRRLQRRRQHRPCHEQHPQRHDRGPA
ncbi:hypothetical protein [Fontivita pretiosa]|uniref:hypothetical protein n=1 Tax=Fontivita pretiosa TaxID=2989684 RepID=UPI003D179591